VLFFSRTGCFDSEAGASGSVQPILEQEYGAQDFFGLIDEMRVWKRVRTPEQIVNGMHARLREKGHTGWHDDPGTTIDPKDPDLVSIFL
jgi:hypothetical protein